MVKKYFVLLSVFVALSVLSKLPYFNLYISFWNSIFVLFFLFACMFRIRSKVYYCFGLLLVLLMLVSLLLGKEYSAEEIGNLVYFVMVIGFIQDFISYIMKTKKK